MGNQDKLAQQFSPPLDFLLYQKKQKCHPRDNDFCVSSPETPSFDSTWQEFEVTLARKYMTLEMSWFLFADETRAILDGSYGWANFRGERHQHLQLQQHDGGILLWCGVTGGADLLAQSECLKFLVWLPTEGGLGSPSRCHNAPTYNIVFMHDNASSFSATTTQKCLGS